jgi:peptidoglycan/xylan/chitin deacetylase (PgdA/CDA1 family)
MNDGRDTGRDTGPAPAPLILMYHSVTRYQTDPYRVTVDPRRFDRQLRWLRRRGRRGVSVRELLAARDGGGPGAAAGLVALTFDDGYRDFTTEVMPALARYGFTATVYVLPGRFGGHNGWDTPGPRKELMSADEVRAVAAAGLEVGSHGLLHRKLPELDPAELAEEVGGSRRALADLLGRDVPGFCFPYGHAGAREVDAVRAAGYDYACAIWRSELTGRHALPRTFVGDRDTAPRLYAKWARHRLAGRARAGRPAGRPAARTP